MRTANRLRMWLLAGAVLALAIPARAADANKYLPDDTDIVVMFNVKQVLDSPLAKKQGQEQIRDAIKSNDKAARTLEAFGFDPFKDLHSITAAISLGGNEPKTLVVAQGQFDTAKFEQKAEEVAKDLDIVLAVHKEGDHKIYEIKAKEGPDDPGFVGLIDKTTIVLSNEKEYVVEAFAKSAGKKGTIKKELEDLIKEVDPKQSFWFVAPGSAFVNSPLAANPEAKKSLDKIEHISGGITIENDVKFVATITAKGADAAKELAEDVKQGIGHLQGILALLAGQNKELAPAADILGGIKVDVEGRVIKMKSEVSEELIQKNLKKDQ